MRLLKLIPYDSKLVNIVKIMYSLKGIPEWYAKILMIGPKVYSKPTDEYKEVSSGNEETTRSTTEEKPGSF